jgi:quinol monooxygenase YgiN
MSPNRWLLSCLVAALLTVTSASWAQAPQQQQYVVIYVVFLPDDANKGKKLLEDLATQTLKNRDVINFSAARQIDRDNQFVLVERWKSAQAYQAYKASPTWTAFVAKAQPLLAAPLDERDGVLLR